MKFARNGFSVLGLISIIVLFTAVLALAQVKEHHTKPVPRGACSAVVNRTGASAMKMARSGRGTEVGNGGPAKLPASPKTPFTIGESCEEAASR